MTCGPFSPSWLNRGSIRAIGGSGTGYSWSLSTNASGATLDPITGAYMAGPTPNVTDVISVPRFSREFGDQQRGGDTLDATVCLEI
jgi:hypothetical protein